MIVLDFWTRKQAGNDVGRQLSPWEVSGEIEAQFAPIGAKSVLKKMLSYRNSVPFYLPKGKALRLSLMLRLPFHSGFLKESWITMPASLNNGFTRLVSLVQLTIIELYLDLSKWAWPARSAQPNL